MPDVVSLRSARLLFRTDAEAQWERAAMVERAGALADGWGELGHEAGEGAERGRYRRREEVN
jgi:hypothetical protein